MKPSLVSKAGRGSDATRGARRVGNCSNERSIVAQGSELGSKGLVARCLPLLVVVFSILVGGCAATRPAPSDMETGVVRLEKLEVPEKAGVWEAGQDRIGWEADSYRLQSGDELHISVLYNSDLYTVTRVLPDGTVPAPVIGQVEAAGKTPNELAAIIASGLSQFLVEPKVSVILSKLAGNYVFVLGEVRLQGAYEIFGPMTVTQVIARAGGATNSGKLNSVLLLRRTSPDAVTGMRINVDWLLKNRATSKDRIVRAYDIVYVPTTFIGKLDVFIEQFFGRTSSPLLWYIWMRYAVDWTASRDLQTPAPK